jgi:aminopeptidase N
MFGRIAGFEFRYQVRQPVFWIGLIIFFLLPFGSVVVDQIHIGSGGNVHRNSPTAIAQVCLTLSVFYLFITTAFVSNVVIRDDETGFGPIIRSTPVSKVDYLYGRFFGAWFAAALGFAAVPLGVFIGSLMPWVDSDQLGPNHLADYAYGYFALGLPTLFFTATILFALATVTRSMMWTYVGLIALLVGYLASSAALARKPELEEAFAYGDPFGFSAVFRATKYWTASERNTVTPPLSAALLGSRLIWTGISVVILALTLSVFQFRRKGAKLRKHQRLLAMAPPETAPPLRAIKLPKAAFGPASSWAQFIARTRFEMDQVFRSPAFFVLMALGLLNSLSYLWFNREIYGAEIYPVTRLTIQALEGTFSIIPLIVAIYYAGELVWRERDRKTAEIVDATPTPDWAFVFPKALSIALVLIATLLISVVGGMLVQTLKGYTNFEFGKYLFWYVLPASTEMLLLAILAVFFQAIAPHKFVGWGLMVVFLISTLVLSQIGLEDNLYQYGSGPNIPLSDMNGRGHFWIGHDWFRVYWTAFAVLLLILSYGLWRRGTETRLWPRVRHLPSVFRGVGGLVALLALIVFAGSGVYIYMNTHVWNEYRTSKSHDQLLADTEKVLLAKYEVAKPGVYMPEPTATAVKVDLDLYPHEQRLVSRGSVTLENRTGAPLERMLLGANEDLKLVRVDVPGAHVETDYPKFNYRLFRFDKPLAPGASVVMSFVAELGQKGFRNSGNQTRIVDNGTFVNNAEFAPMIGIDRSGLLQDRAKRKLYGLPPELRIPKLEDQWARAHNYVGNAPWVMSDITVTTDADQTPIAPGYKVKDVTHGGRRTVEFKTDAPILAFFSVQSARYVEKHANYKGIDIGVYYDRQHPYNVDRMIKTAERGLDYYQANFSPYQFHQFRFIEFPDYAQFAQSFANTVPWSEGLGFVADLRHAEGAQDVDYVTFVGAHELGHQWWAHQEISAEMQGGTMLVETLAQYSALMVMEKTYGPDQIRKFLKYELDNYLRSRGSEAVEENPLMRVENQPYIHYRKGAVVMYLLKDQIGEDAVNRALRKLLAQTAFKGPPYASSKDLVDLFRAEAPADKQQLITDLFEKITIYDLQAIKMTVTKRPDGKYAVRLVVDAKKNYADGKGKETAAPIGGETFDVGLFTEKPGEKAFTSKNVLVFKRVSLTGGRQVFDFVTDKAPTWGGVDPYNKYIDRNSDDNLVAGAPR